MCRAIARLFLLAAFAAPSFVCWLVVSLFLPSLSLCVLRLFLVSVPLCVCVYVFVCVSWLGVLLLLLRVGPIAVTRSPPY